MDIYIYDIYIYIYIWLYICIYIYIYIIYKQCYVNLLKNKSEVNIFWWSVGSAFGVFKSVLTH